MKTPKVILAAAIGGLLAACTGGEMKKQNADSLATAGNNYSQPVVPAWMLDEMPPANDETDTSIYEATITEEALADSLSGEENPQQDTQRIKVRALGRLTDVFNDSNKYQYAAAERIGIAPLKDINSAYFTRRPLVKIQSCEWYHLDTLTHSMPYLVPEAAALLEDIGRNFADSLAHRGGGKHLFRVTSVLRSPMQVRRLRRVNRNATDSSTHQFATTFDISYARFMPAKSGKQVSDEDLKNTLAEVLFDLRRQGRCLVKYEIHSPCFHITATGRK